MSAMTTRYVNIFQHVKDQVLRSGTTLYSTEGAALQAVAGYGCENVYHHLAAVPVKVPVMPDGPPGMFGPEPTAKGGPR